MTIAEDSVQENELVEVAMQIILHAGDARQDSQKAIDSLKTFDFKTAEECMEDAKNNIREAHLAQTKIIQDEARGKSYMYSLLFTHAQDTLMTIKSEVILINNMIDVFKMFYNKLKTEGVQNND